MSLTFEATRELFRAGRYVEIVTQGEYDERALISLQPEHRVLVAHAMFQAGKIDRAHAIVERERERATGIVRSKCELISGLICRHNAQFGKAIEHYNAAYQIAREHGNDVEAAWSLLHRFRLLAQLHPSDELTPMLAEVRRCVAKSGDPHATAYMHDAVALMEVSNGRPQEARRHLDICRSLLRAFPNAGLEQAALISTACVDFVECKYHDALESLSAARRLVAVSGSRASTVIDSNQGHVLLNLGQFKNAEAFFGRAIEQETGHTRFAALEGLARVHLAAGHLTRCAETLDRHEAFLLQDRNMSRAFSGRWAASTRLRLLLKQGLYKEATHVAKRSLDWAQGLTDGMLVHELTCLLSEALVACGQDAEAALLLVRVAARETNHYGNANAEYYRALSYVVSPATGILRSEFTRRSRRIYVHQGNKCGEAELEALRPAHDAAAAGRDDALLLLVSGIASLLANADTPGLIGQELVQAAKLLDCSPRTEMIESVDVPREATVTEQHVVLPLGQTDGKLAAVSFALPAKPRQVAALAELTRIGMAAVALQQARRESRDKAALWPADQIDSQAGALFLAEEMQTLLATARRVAATNVPVLITGETGTGKEVLARAIHACSSRARAPFVPFNCTSTPRDMLDSQLFGHRRGSFTGAIEHFQGIIRGAAGGTLFLDEIGDMGLEVQPKLLRFLESGEVHPVGETQPVRADVRVVAATNANLDTLVAEGRFREDLFYRLNIVHLQIPPLRERRIEIPALAHHYLEKYAAEYAKGNLRLAEETMEYLVLYRWPGNVRQLANEMRRMAALCEPGAVVMPEHLSTPIAASRRTIPPSERVLDPTEVVVRLDQPLAAATEHLERALIQHALKQCGGRMEETAAKLGLSRKGLYLKRQRFGIEPPESATVAV